IRGLAAPRPPPAKRTFEPATTALSTPSYGFPVGPPAPRLGQTSIPREIACSHRFTASPLIRLWRSIARVQVGVAAGAPALEPWRLSDHPLLLESGQLLVTECQTMHVPCFVACTDRPPRPTQLARGTHQPWKHTLHPDLLPEVLCDHPFEHPALVHMRIVDDLLDTVDRRNRHAGFIEGVSNELAVMPSDPIAHDRVDLRDMGRTVRMRRELRVFGHVFATDRAKRAKSDIVRRARDGHPDTVFREIHVARNGRGRPSAQALRYVAQFVIRGNPGTQHAEDGFQEADVDHLPATIRILLSPIQCHRHRESTEIASRCIRK